MEETRNNKNPMRDKTTKKKFFTKPTYKNTFYCKNCHNESTFDIVKGVEIIDQKDGTIFEKGFDGEIKLFECKTCGSSKHLYQK
jgi:hypothetical protein